MTEALPPGFVADEGSGGDLLEDGMAYGGVIRPGRLGDDVQRYAVPVGDEVREQLRHDRDVI